jgi:hypothetical protein
VSPAEKPPGLARIVAAQGRWILVIGLILGLASPALAGAVRPWVGPMVVALLFLAALRVGPAILSLSSAGLRQAGLAALLLQLGLPGAVALVLATLGALATPMAQAAVLILAAVPITGAAHIAVMAGGDPAPALRQTVIGTALLPLTVLPVFALVPSFATGVADLAQAVLRLLAIIALAGGAALVLRRTGLVSGTPRNLMRIDASAAILLGVVVIGLMSAAAETLRTAPLAFLGAMGLVCAIAFGMQALALLWRARDDTAAVPLAVAAGNRNVALFLSVLPAAAVDPLLLLIGCYQIPMYLTPLILPRLRRWLGRGGPAAQA